MKNSTKTTTIATTFKKLAAMKLKLDAKIAALQAKCDSIRAEYIDYTKKVTDEVDNELVKVGMICEGYCDSSHGPFHCSTIYKFNDRTGSIRVLFNVCRRPDEFGYKNNEIKYNTNNGIKTTKFKNTDCFVIKDLKNEEIYMRSSLRGTVALVKKLQSKM
jgi:hypothetical protein